MTHLSIISALHKLLPIDDSGFESLDLKDCPPPGRKSHPFVSHILTTSIRYHPAGENKCSNSTFFFENSFQRFIILASVLVSFTMKTLFTKNNKVIYIKSFDMVLCLTTNRLEITVPVGLALNTNN